MAVKPVPDGYSTVTPYLVQKDTGAAIEYYKKAFGAQEVYRMPGPGGRIMHAELRIGNSMIMMGDEFPQQGAVSPQTLGGTPVSLFLYLADVDETFRTAVAAGAKSVMEPTDMFWGDRFGKLTDPFGHEWGLATHKEDVSQEEMKKRSAAAFANPS